MMLSTYNEICLLDESLAYHLSTNYFRNPLFDSESLLNNTEDEAENGATTAATTTKQTNQDHKRMQASSSSVWRPCEDKNKAATKYLGGKNCFAIDNKNKMHSYLQGKRKKFGKFCDNLALTCKGKLFVMELNLKRRLDLVRAYLDRMLPWLLPSKLGSRSSWPRAATPDVYCSSSSSSSEQQQNCYLQDGGSSFWADLRPPKSSECLSEQQERILERLARVKRVSQKLVCSENELVQQQDEQQQQQQQQQRYGADDCAATTDLETSSKQYGRLSAQTLPFGPFACRSLNGCVHSEPIVMSQSMPWACGSGGALETELASARCSSKPVASGAKRARPAETASTSSRNLLKRGKLFVSSGNRIRNATQALARARHNQVCIVCYTNVPNIVTMPCRHHEICSDCFIEIIYMAVKHRQFPLKCVLCRQKIEKIRCSRHLLLSVIEKNRNKAN